MRKIHTIMIGRKGEIRARICPRCGGHGTMLSGETCYYCQGTGTVED